MPVTESIEFVDGVQMNQIAPIDRMDPFLMTIVSNSDLWMFVSSAGGRADRRADRTRTVHLSVRDR